MTTNGDGIPPLFKIAFIIVGIGFVGFWTLMITGFLRSRKALNDAGMSPFTAGAKLISGLANGPLTGKTTEQRLKEIDDLRQRGVISDEEHVAARAKILGEN